VINSFRDTETEKVFDLVRSRRLPTDIQLRAKVKLDQLHAASELNHLRVPPGNRLEALSGDRAGQHSIRINQQWRICFLWTGQDADDVEICDYH
jgi:proteic killer suppression protein